MAAKPAGKLPAPPSSEEPAPPRSWDVGVFLSATYLMDEQEFSRAIKASPWEHYVYGLCLDNRAVFYVGKGVRGRALEHAKAAARGDDSEKAAYIRQIGPRLRYTLFYQTHDEAYALAYEAYLIQGHHDVLTNVVVPTYEGIERAFTPKSPMQQLIDSVIKLIEVEKIIKAGDQQCKRAMQAIINDCPQVISTLTDDDLAWALDHTDGAFVRQRLQKLMKEGACGCQ